MKTKISLLAFLLLPLSAFAVCDSSRNFSYPSQLSTVQDQCDYYISIAPYYEDNGLDCKYVRYDKISSSSGSCTYSRKYFIAYSSGTACPSNTSRTSDGVCSPTCSSGTFDIVTSTCVASPLSAYNNNPDGCKTAGGVYFSDKVCRSTADAFAKIASSPQFVAGIDFTRSFQPFHKHVSTFFMANQAVKL